jgi:hypothetical protein
MAMDKAKLRAFIEKATSPMTTKPLGELTKEEATAKFKVLARKFEAYVNKAGGNKTYNVLDAYKSQYTDKKTGTVKPTWLFLVKTANKEGKLLVDAYGLYGWTIRPTNTIPANIGSKGEPDKVLDIYEKVNAEGKKAIEEYIADNQQ